MEQANNKNKTDTLLIISPGFPSDHSDSTCLPSIQNIVLTLNELYPRLKIVILSLHYPRRKDKYLWNGNEVFTLGNGNSKSSRLSLWIRAIYSLYRINRKMRIIGLLSLWCQESALLAKAFANLRSLKHFIWIQGQDASAANYLVKWIRPKADELIALSPFLAQEFKKNHGTLPANVVMAGINPSHVSPDKTPRTIDILGVGSLIPLKQYDLFIFVVSEIIRAGRNIHVELVGGGPEKERLKSMISKNGLDDVVTLCGELGHGEVMDKMQRSKILLHPSRYEGYSTVAVEALYCGCHVISLTWAEDRNIEQWHVVDDQQQMVSSCLRILSDAVEFKSVLANDLRSEMQKLMQLYAYEEMAL
jgi:glycosyltransferase involved in cell wall biosynthesis